MEYEEIIEELGLDAAGDLKAAKLLNELVEDLDPKRMDAIRGRCVIVFGAGPSLISDIARIRSENLHHDCFLIAADGAVKALLDNNIVPDMLVTDLDGDIDAIFKANSKGVTTLVHAHSDNVDRIKEFVPKLRDVIGTTQVKPFGRLHNFGGFTDGDRAAFIAVHFKAGLIVLAGMDFGFEVGEHSFEYDVALKPRKLRIGKQLLEELAERTLSGIVNLTNQGERLKGIPRISVKQLKLIAAQMR